MFKELKVLKLVIALAILLVILFMLNYEKYSGILIYPTESSFEQGDDITIGYVSYRNTTIDQTVSLSDWKGNEMNKIVVKSSVTPQTKWDVFHNGPIEANSRIILSSASANLYFINDSIPVVVTSKLPRDITVVLPQTGQLFIQRFFGMNAVDSIQLALWKNRPLAIDDKTKRLLNWLADNYSNNSIQFVTDLTTNCNEIFHQSKVVIVYGYNRFMSIQFHNALKDYWNNGGKLFFISSYFPQYLVRHVDKQIHAVLDTTGALVDLDHKFIPFTYLLGGMPVTTECLSTIDKSNWPDKVPFFANGVGISGGGDGYLYTVAIESSYSAITTSGIGYFERMISIPSDEWLSPVNFEKHEVRNLTKLLLDELLK
jgi:hypothetical protein